MCGITSKLNLGILEEYVKAFDIVCLSETKSDNIEDVAIEGYTPILMPKKSKEHKYGGIHGLCTFVKNKIFDCAHVLNETNSESILWLKFDQKAFGTAFIVGNVYIAHEGSNYHNEDIFDKLAK